MHVSPHGSRSYTWDGTPSPLAGPCICSSAVRFFLIEYTCAHTNAVNTIAYKRRILMKLCIRLIVYFSYFAMYAFVNISFFFLSFVFFLGSPELSDAPSSRTRDSCVSVYDGGGHSPWVLWLAMPISGSVSVPSTNSISSCVSKTFAARFRLRTFCRHEEHSQCRLRRRNKSTT